MIAPLRVRPVALCVMVSPSKKSKKEIMAEKKRRDLIQQVSKTAFLSHLGVTDGQTSSRRQMMDGHSIVKGMLDDWSMSQDGKGISELTVPTILHRTSIM